MKKHPKQILLLILAVIMILTSCTQEGSDTLPGEQTQSSADLTTAENDDTAKETEKETEKETASPSDTVSQDTEGTASDTAVSTETDKDTEVNTTDTAKDTDSSETEGKTEAETDAETEKTDTPAENNKGVCGNILWNKSDKKVGLVRIDSFKHQVSAKEYKSSISNYKVTVEENTGIFEIRGWVGMNFSDFELAWRIGTDSDVEYRNWSVNAVSREPAVLQAANSEGYSNATGFVYYFSIDGFKSGDIVHLFLKDKAADTVYCFCEITVNIKEAEQDSGTTDNKYVLGYGSDMDMSEYDPVSDKETAAAADDDPSVKLWFDHITEKVTRYDTSGKDSGRTDYTVQMGKNETEGCQFFLYSPTARKVTIKISDFENSAGNTLETQLGVEYYIEDGYVTYHGYPADYVYPDAVIPYASYIANSATAGEHGRYGNDADSKFDYGPFVAIGPFSGSDWDHDKYPFRESVRGFVVQAVTKEDTAPGKYRATIEIYDYDTGKCIKAANVYAYVYDVTLSEETALDTAFNLWSSSITDIYTHLGYTGSTDDVLRRVADFFLDHRITLTGNRSFTDLMGTDWLRDPRVTSVRVLSKDQYESYKGDDLIKDKMFYYGQDEPGVARGWRPIDWPNGESETVYDNTGLLSVLAVRREADLIKNEWGWTDYRMLVPFERDIDLDSFNFNSVDKSTSFPSWYDSYAVTDERDAVEYMEDSVNIWASHLFGYTPRELQKTTGSKYIQSSDVDAELGELSERLDGFVSEGAERWAYVSCEPKYTSPYQNILLFNDGTEGRTMFWTSYLNDVTGFLYWHVSYYDAIGNNTYTLRNPFSKTGPGDGILIYPGQAYGQLDPIASVRLINMRDGIEDYQLLAMLEEAKGEEYTDELVKHITTSTLTYTRDDDVIYNVRSFLLRALEQD